MVNFVKHVRAVMYKMEADSRITALHVSLYWALFQTWNEHRFQHPMRIYRDEMMARAKLRTRKAYATGMRELAEWNYITYDPSTRRFEPCFVSMRRFDSVPLSYTPASMYPGEMAREAGESVPVTWLENETSTRTSTGTTTDTSTQPSGDTYSINSINTPNIENTVNAYAPARPVSDAKEDRGHPADVPDADKKGGARGGGGRVAADTPEPVPSGLDAVHRFFASISSTRTEAEKFFHYFSSIGWRVSGRWPMRNWHAAARNWVLNAVNINARNRPTPGRLSSGRDTNLGQKL
jgi:hypothetical protein